MKKIVATMPDDCAAMLKSYAVQFGLTQSELLYEATRSYIHNGAEAGCVACKNLLTAHNVKLDNRASKPCYGWACISCAHDKACRVGKHKGAWEIQERYKHLLSAHIPEE